MRGSNDYFTEGGMFKPFLMAAEVSEHVAVGPEGQFWSYQSKPTRRDDRVGVWVPDPEVIDRRAARILRDKYMLSRGATVERLVRHMDSTRRLTADEPPKWYRLINLQNTMYDWRDDIEEVHDPAYESTIQLPIMYDPEATCPRFDAWLEEVVHDDAAQLVWQSLGYMLMSGNPLQTAFLLLGPEGTAKSTFLRRVERLLGRRNISAESLKSLSQNRFAASSLYGKAANIVGDIDAAYMDDTSLFLQITGGDTMNAEYKGKDAFPFRPFAVPIFSTNKVWQSANTSGAYFRRWTILPFDRKVDRSKPFDESLLDEEAAGVFNKAMAALRMLHSRTILDPVTGERKPKQEFDIYGHAREARELFARDSDPIREWMDDDEMVTADAGNDRLRTPRTTLFARYSEWCRSNGIRRPKTGPEFYKAMRALGYGEVKSNGRPMFVGIHAYVPGELAARA